MRSRQTIQRMKKRVEAAQMALSIRLFNAHTKGQEGTEETEEANRVMRGLTMIERALAYVLEDTKHSPLFFAHEYLADEDSDLRYVLGLAERRCIANGRGRS